jgi:hypothetical protein
MADYGAWKEMTQAERDAQTSAWKKRGIGDELHIEGIPGEGIADWARRAVKECREYGGAAKATFNGVTVRFGTKWEPELVVRQWDRQRRERLAKDGVLASSSPDRPPLRGRFPDTNPLLSADEVRENLPRLNVLAEAARVVSGDRQHSYGHPRENHGCTAVMWTAYLTRKYGADQHALDARDVCMLNALQKISRDANRPKRDNLIDVAGYMRNAEMIDEADE